MSKKQITALIAILSLIMLPGCLYMSIQQDTNFNNSAPLPVKFESKEAADLFFLKTRIIDMKNYKGPYMKEDGLMIPFIAFKNHRTFYETEYTNSKIKETDINSDGLITLKETKNLKYERAALIKRSMTVVKEE